MKKIIFSSVILSAGIFGLSYFSFSNAQNHILGGEENLDNYNGIKQSNTTDNIYTRSITSGYAGGGFWIRGTRGNLAISEYKHYKRQGKASVINNRGNFNDGGWRSKGVFSKARVKKTLTGNKAFYDYR